MSEFIIPNNTPIYLLSCEDAFNELTDTEKLYTHYLSRASWIGGLTIFLQTSYESPLIFALLLKLFKKQSVPDLKKVALEECGLTEEEFQAFLMYAAAFFHNLGNYRGFGDTKIVPDLPKEKFDKFLQSSKFAKQSEEEFNELFKKCHEKIYSLKDNECRLGFPGKGTTTYLSKNITTEDDAVVKEFFKLKNIEAWNTRLFKHLNDDGNVVYEIRLASALNNKDSEEKELLGTHTVDGRQFKVTRGDYAPLMELVNKELEMAMKYAANDFERNMLKEYMRYFRTGALEGHKEGSKYWVQDKGPIVESYIGFVENYRDPSGLRAEFEGFVAVMNKKMSARLNEMVESAERYIAKLPWPKEFEKEKFMRPDFNSLDVVAFASSFVPSGINIPNYYDVKEKFGFKNVTLGNVMSVKPNEPPNYLCKEDQDLMMNYVNSALDLNVAIHELLGHGSGRQFHVEADGKMNFDPTKIINFETNEPITSWYKPGETYDSVYGVLSSTYEECRAECVALHLCHEPEILTLFGHEGEMREIVPYVAWLNMLLMGLEGLQMYDHKNDVWLQAHSRARYCMMQVLLEAGEGLLTVDDATGSDGKPDLLLTLDKSKIASVGKPAIAKFLGRMQLYKATADITAANAMFDKYSDVANTPFKDRREIVIARIKPRRMFVQANTCLQSGKNALKTYEANTEGMIQSFTDRYDEKICSVLEELWSKDHKHFI